MSNTSEVIGIDSANSIDKSAEILVKVAGDDTSLKEAVENLNAAVEAFAVPINNTPPVLFERDSNGLLKHIQHKFLSSGYVDWRAMIPREFLYINPEPRLREKIEKKYGKPIDEIDVEADKVDDSDLVIQLGGIKYLLAIRGFHSAIPSIRESREDYASVSYSINFRQNYETEGGMVLFGENACATPKNTKSFGQKYLVEMATNRAFCRAVRNFLKINIVSSEELGDTKEDGSSNGASATGPLTVLKKLMSDKNVGFADLKQKMISEGCDEAKTWNTEEDISLEQIAELIKRLRKKKA